MFHTSHLEISRSAFGNNLEFLRKMVGKNVEISSVVKGNAYGHGISIIVPMAEDLGMRHFSVFSAYEAVQVQNAIRQQDSKIMIMGMLDNDELQWAIENDIEFFVFEMDRLSNALRIAEKMGKKARIHIEVETGMNRTGFEPAEMPGVIYLMQQNSNNLIFKGLCTHYAGAESIANYYRIKKQRSIFNRISKQFANDGLTPEKEHTACSAAAMRYPNTRMDMIRVGILQYGFFPSREVLVEYLTQRRRQDYPLQRLISWKSSIMDIKRVKTGEFIGYGTSYLANQDMIIAIVPIGYSHGFSRSLSNHGRVLINGHRVAVVGMVNMNMMTIDVTYLNDVKKGDEVVLIGKQGDQEISVASFGEYSDQVNYELLTRLPADIPRKVID